MLEAEKVVRGGTLPIKDGSHAKVREGQRGYHRLLGRCSLPSGKMQFALQKFPLVFFFSPQRNKRDVESSTEAARRG